MFQNKVRKLVQHMVIDVAESTELRLESSYMVIDMAHEILLEARTRQWRAGNAGHHMEQAVPLDQIGWPRVDDKVVADRNGAEVFAPATH